MDDGLLYETGLYSAKLRFSITLDLWKRPMDPTRASMLARFLEIWCEENCEEPWGVRQTERFITIRMQSSADMTLFRFSEDYSYFEDIEIVVIPDANDA